MDHNAYKEQLSALLDGELDETGRSAALAHLAECEECRAYFAELNAMRDALNDLGDDEPPADFAAGVLARLHGEAAPQTARKRSPWRGWAALAACAAVIVLAVSALPGKGMKSASSEPSLAAAPAAAPTAPSASGEPAAAADASAETEAYGFAGGAPSDLADNWLETSAVEAPYDERDVKNAGTENEAAELSVPLTTTCPFPETAPGAPASDTAGEPAESDPLWTLTLEGEGAAEWLAENAEPLGGGLWRVSVEAANDLPDTLMLTGLQEPQDGTLIILFGTPENPQ